MGEGEVMRFSVRSIPGEGADVECFYRVGATGIGALGAVGMGRSVDALGAENE